MLRDFLILSRVQLRALAYSLAPRKRGGGSDHGRTLRLMGVGVGLALLALLAVIYMAFVGFALAMLGMARMIPVAAVAMGSLAGVFFAFAKAGGMLFGLADFDHLMALPVSRRVVVASRLSAAYATAIGLAALFMVPLYAAYFSTQGAAAWPVVCAVLSVVLAPLAPVSVAVALAFCVQAAAARFRHANLAFVVFGLVGFTAIMAGSIAVSVITRTADSSVVAHAALDFAMAAESSVAGAYPPAVWAADAVCRGSVPGMAAFTALSLAVPALTLELVQRNYLTLNGVLASRGRRKALSRDHLGRATGRTASPFAALVVKELRTLMGVPSYAINCVFGYLFMLLVAVGVSVLGLRGVLTSGTIDGVQLDQAVVEALIGQITLLIPWVFAFCAVMSPSAACAVSLEGRSAWIMSTAPVSARTVLGAKLASNAGPQAVALAVSSVILLVSGQTDAPGALEIFLVGLGVFCAVIALAMACDVRRPNYAWSSPNEVVKRGLPMGVAVMGGMILVFIGGAVCWAVSSAAGIAAGHALNLGVAAGGFATGALVMRRIAREPLYLA